MDESSKLQNKQTTQVNTGVGVTSNNDVDLEKDTGPIEREFEVTSDLNIAPVKETPPVEALNLDNIKKTAIPSQLQSTVSSIIESDPLVKQVTPKPIIKEGPNVRSMRTYESDIAEAMSHNKISSASIAIAESKRNENGAINKTSYYSENSFPVKNVLITLISLILIGGGITGAYYLYSKSPLAPTIVEQQIQPAVENNTIAPKDAKVTIAIDDLFPNAIISKVEAEINKPKNNNSIEEIVFTKNINGKTTIINSIDMTRLMDISVPDILLRSLKPEWMFGVYTNEEGQKNIFVIVTNNFFQNTFAGMLQWENTMAEDLRQYINVPKFITKIKKLPNETVSNPTNNVLSTSSINSLFISSSNTSTPASTKNISTSTETYETPYYPINGKFIDRIIKNKDVREFVNTDDQILFLYSFIDNNTLIITKNEASLNELLSRLEKQSLVR